MNKDEKLAIEEVTGLKPEDIFDPSPSYYGSWYFTVDNLAKNAKVITDGNKKVNLFEKFYYDTYEKPLMDAFNGHFVVYLKSGLESIHKDNLIGRHLVYARNDFYTELILLLRTNIDLAFLNAEEKKEYQQELLKYLEIPKDKPKSEFDKECNLFFSNAFKKKADKLKDVLDKGKSSDYYDAAYEDYKLFNVENTFDAYVNGMYILITGLQKGLLNFDGFFDREIDYNKFAQCFEPDTLYLLFAKIILEFILRNETKYQTVDESYRYLDTYKKAIDKFSKVNKKYDPKIFYTDFNGRKYRYSKWNFINEFNELKKRHPEIKEIPLPDFSDSDDEKYKDINLIQKLKSIYENSTEVNWEFLPKGETIKKGITNEKDDTQREKEKKDNEELIQEVNERIDYFESSGYVGRPIKGLDTFSGYYAFVYPNGKVILENFWENEKTMRPACYCATYVMSIDNFIDMSKISKINLIEYIKLFPESGIKRIFHTNFTYWKSNIEKEIKGSPYRLEEVIDFISKLQTGELKK